jgi:hypothetical protein
VAAVAVGEGARRALRLIGPGAGVAAAIVLPFFLLDPSAFWQHNVVKMTSAGFRRDAFCIPTLWVRATGVSWPELLSLAIGLGTFGYLVRWMKKRCGDDGGALPGTDWAGALFVLYGTTFLFARFAFCNYYYLLAAIGLLFLTLRDSSVAESG